MKVSWPVAVALAGQLFCSAQLAADDGLRNQLADHPAPYLAMHGEDPVHWQRWSRQTLETAQRLNRPLFISSGYFACHWCHVMQRESYRNAAIADLLNSHFIPVKIDRELNPALDAHLIEFVELTRGQAGWPLNVFLTPDGYPLVGMVYEPPERFQLLLQRLQQRWQADEPALRKAATDAMQEWQQRLSPASELPVSTGDLQAYFDEQAASLKDELAGGFGEQNKFPMVSQLSAMLARDDDANHEFLQLTLDRMADQGLHDNLGGGFFRYTVDPAWQTPHYEKMLYDNARLAMLYLQAGEHYSGERYRQLGLQTVDFLLGAMRHPGGGFKSSFSAVDSAGREGAYYLWTSAQLQAQLKPQELQLVQAAWFDIYSGESGGGALPRWQDSPARLAAQLGLSSEAFAQRLDSARRKLLAARAGRELPEDDKVIAGWNGLVLSALAGAARVTADAAYVEAGRQLADYLARQLRDSGQLLRVQDPAGLEVPAGLEDYALVAQGLWDWSRLKLQDWQHDQALAAQLVRVAWQRFYHEGHWRNTDTPLIPMIEGSLALQEGAVPSASAVISRISDKHPALLSDRPLQKLLREHLGFVRQQLGESIFWYAGYLEILSKTQR